MIRILAISGSLRRRSSNTTVLVAAGMLAPEGVSIALYDDLSGLPHFNPDDEEAAGPAVREFQARLREADAVLISSPEYAHGVPGVLKNALDWVVGSGEFVDKPVALINASPHSTYAYASLIETISVMSARVVQDACVTLPFWDKTLSSEGVVAHAEISGLLKRAVTELVGAVNKGAAA